MTDVRDMEIPALVGVMIQDKVIYNTVDRDGEFFNTGMSMINFLKHDTNKFVALMFESQNYESIKAIYDDEFVFGEPLNNQNRNIDSFQEIHKLMENDTLFDHFYILDLLNNTLIAKIPEQEDVIALDYRYANDIREFINNII
jgi:hypothetical protein